jgi:outer membrane protein assembly factor BamB
MRWVAGPLHEASNMITAGGRLFCAGLIARDAFNGIRLWEREIEPSPMRLGYPAAALPGSVLPVAAGDLLFVFDEGKVRALEAATGQEVRTYPDAGAPLEILHLEGAVVSMDQWSVKAIDVESGKLLWSTTASEPRSIVAGDGAVFFLEGDLRRGEPASLVRLEARSGKVEWKQTESPWLRKVKRLSYRRSLLVCEGSTYSNDKPGNEIHALDAKEGKEIWQRAYEPGMSHYTQARAIHSDGLVWVQNGGKLDGIEPSSGAVTKTFVTGTGHCYPPVATARYFLAGEMSLTDLEGGQVDLNPISKGNCSRDAGFVPANGLIYCAPKHCTCWPLVQGYVALAPARSGGMTASRGEKGPPQSEEDPEPLVEQGPAFEPSSARLAKEEDPEAWPCYRADAWRSAGTRSAVPPDLKPLWTAKVGGWPKSCPADWRENPFLRGPVTPPVIAEGLAVVAQGDGHRVAALDAETGSLRWEFTANGRIDSPPTIWGGLCLFGTRTGWVWCLRAEDGKPAWRLRVAANEERIVSFGQIESPWPVPGSVLVAGGVAYFAGGRHPLSDGGIRVFAADPRTGKILWRKRITKLPMTSFYGGTGLEFDPFDMLVAESRRPAASAAGTGGSSAAPPGVPDFISLSRWQLSPATGDVSVVWKSGFGHFKTGEPGVMAPRGVWTYGPRPEYVPSGPRPGRPDYIGARPRPLVAFRGGTVFSSTHDKRGVFRRDFSPKDIQEFDDVWYNQRDVPRDAKKEGDRTRSQRLGRGAGWTAQVFAPEGSPDATGLPPGEIAAFVLSGDVVFAAGTKGWLVALSAADGKKLAQLEAPPPVWDGMAAASGRLYVSTQEGDIVCFGKNP